MNRAAPTEKRIPRLLPVAVLLGAAVALRLVFLFQVDRLEVANLLSLDSSVFRDVAHGVVAGGKLPPGALTFNPFYPIFLIVVFKIFGEGLLVPRLVQLALGVATVWIVYAGGRRLASGAGKGKRPGEATAIIAAAMAILYAQFMLYEGMILATAFEVFFLAASFALALAIDDGRRRKRLEWLGSRSLPFWVPGFLLGALCGAGALCRPNLFLLLIAALPVWLLARLRPARVALPVAASCLVGAAIFVAPPILYNAHVTGRFVPVTAHGGINFYMGNRLGSTGIFEPLDGVPSSSRGIIEGSREKAEAETGRTMTDSETSDYYLHKGLEEIRSDPKAWMRLLSRKLLLFFNGAELFDVPNVVFYERSCGVVRLLFIPFALISPLALCGLVILLRSGRHRSAVLLFLGCTVASVVLFFVNSRYRLPAVPLLILLAAFFLAWAAREVSRARWKGVAIMAAGAAAIFVLVSHRDMVEVNYSAAYAFLGKYYVEREDKVKAAEAFAEAYRLDPSKVEAIINYATILHERGENEESAELFASAYARAPDYPRLALKYGSVLDIIGRHEEAKRLYRSAASSSLPEDRLLACRILAEASLAEGKRDEAIVWLKRALEMEPGDRELAAMLKKLLGAP